MLFASILPMTENGWAKLGGSVRVLNETANLLVAIPPIPPVKVPFSCALRLRLATQSRPSASIERVKLLFISVTFLNNLKTHFRVWLKAGQISIREIALRICAARQRQTAAFGCALELGLSGWRRPPLAI